MCAFPTINEIVTASLEPMIAVDKKTCEVSFVNNNAKEFFKLESNNPVLLQYFCSHADLFNYQKACEVIQHINSNNPVLHDWPVRLGVIKWLSAYMQLRVENDTEYVLISFRDNTMAKESLLRFDNLLAFRDMMDDLLAYNTNVNINDFSLVIDQALERVGQFFNCDRSYVFQFSDDLLYQTNTNEWCAHGIESYKDALQNIPNSKFPYLKKELLKLETVCLSDINDLPHNAFEERAEFAKEGIKSILLIPFRQGNKAIGFIGLDHVNAIKRWSNKEVSNLKLFARTIANILARKRSEKKITDNRNMYQTLFDAANDSIAVIRNGVCVDANRKALVDLRAEYSELKNKSVIELSAVEQPNGKSASYSNVYLGEAEKGMPQTFEWRVRRLDGTEYDTEITLNNFSCDNENLVIAIFRSIENRKVGIDSFFDDQSEDGYASKGFVHVDNRPNILNVFEVDQLQRLQDAFSEATGISSLITNAEGHPITKLSFTNGVCAKVRSSSEGQRMCMESGKLLGEKAKEARCPVSNPCFSCGFIDAASPIIVNGHHVGNWLIGQVRPKDLTIESVLKYTHKLGLDDQEIKSAFLELPVMSTDNFNKIISLLNVLTIELSCLGYNNVKLEKTLNNHLIMERELRKAKQNAEESDRLKSAFLANMSHEIRTPMNGIVGFSELLQYDGLTPADRRDYVRLIHQSSSQLLNIINDIIDISKIESGQIDVKANYFDLVKVGVDLENFFIDMARPKGVQLIFANRESVDVELFTDEVKLRQVLTNLISNAVKFTSVGNVTYGFESVDKTFIKLFVEDSGSGIHDDDLDVIFDRFWQAKDTDVKKGGTGLGLAITKAYVELLGGKIEVESEKGKGTRFSFVIPKVLK